MRERPEAPLVEVGAGTYVISPEGKLLLLETEHAGNPERWWTSPGGGMERGESIEQCAVRETLEESGVHVRLTRLLAVREVWRGDAMKVVGFLFLAEPDPWPQTPSPQEQDGLNRFVGYGWFGREEIAGLRVPPDELYLRVWPTEIMTPVLQRFEDTPDGWRELRDDGAGRDALVTPNS
jgi:ADP-ribose pyrophosphatase YjhB (NUDIX family)